MTTVRLFPLLLALLLSWPLSALGALERVEEAYELGVNEVTLPAHSASQVVIRSCSGCDPVVLPVSSKTVYRVDGMPVALDALRAAAAADADRLVLVFYATATGVVTRIELP